MKRILFVDSEELVLQALQRTLRGMRGEWDMVFAGTSEEALDKMREAPFDLIVSDVQTRGLDGVALLEATRLHYPQTIRFVLSGSCDREEMVRIAGPTHQFLAKPCEMEELKTKIIEALASGDLVANPTARRLISGLSSVPSPPALYFSVMEELQSKDPSTAKVGKIIARDPSMTAKILQMVNSSLFGFRRRISSAEQGVTLLGLDTISTLVLSAHVFSQFDPVLLSSLSLEKVGENALLSGTLSKEIARAERAPENMREACFTAGILHDFGKLLLGTGYPDMYKKAMNLAQSENIPDWMAELEIFSCTHAETGACLLGIWGLPIPIVEAVAWHQRPSASLIAVFHPVLPVHAAAAFVDHLKTPQAWNEALDREFLRRLGIENREAAWVELFKESQVRAS